MHPRHNNLMIFDVPETNGNYHSCEMQMLLFLNDHAKYKKGDADVERANRIGKL